MMKSTRFGIEKANSQKVKRILAGPPSATLATAPAIT